MPLEDSYLFWINFTIGIIFDYFTALQFGILDKNRKYIRVQNYYIACQNS